MGMEMKHAVCNHTKFLYTQNSIPSNRYDYKNYSCDYDGQKMNVIYKAGTVLLFSLTSLNKITC